LVYTKIDGRDSGFGYNRENFSEKGGRDSSTSFDLNEFCSTSVENSQEEVVELRLFCFVLFFMMLLLVETLWLVH